jgi:hypothetical protein
MGSYKHSYHKYRTNNSNVTEYQIKQKCVKTAQLSYIMGTAYKSEPKFLGIHIFEDTKSDVHIQ